PFVHLERRDPESARSLELADAGQEVEKRGGSRPEGWTAGKKTDVSVNAGGGRIVVAGAEVNIAADRIRIAPDHQAELGVNFVADQAVDNVYASLFQLPRPENVVRLVES